MCLCVYSLSALSLQPRQIIRNQLKEHPPAPTRPQESEPVIVQHDQDLTKVEITLLSMSLYYNMIAVHVRFSLLSH